jgi:hypothetical protein
VVDSPVYHRPELDLTGRAASLLRGN